MNIVLKIVLIGMVSTGLLAGGAHEHDHESNQSSIGAPGKGAPDLEVMVSMRDSMRFIFKPSLDSINDGTTVEFLVHNDGTIEHEFSIGDAEEQVKHAQMMRESPTMKHQDANTLSLAPGQTGSLSWRFTGTETVVFSCNLPGHFEAGMKHLMTIAPGNSL